MTRVVSGAVGPHALNDVRIAHLHVLPDQVRGRLVRARARAS